MKLNLHSPHASWHGLKSWSRHERSAEAGNGVGTGCEREDTKVDSLGDDNGFGLAGPEDGCSAH